MKSLGVNNIVLRYTYCLNFCNYSWRIDPENIFIYGVKSIQNC